MRRGIIALAALVPGLLLACVADDNPSEPIPDLGDAVTGEEVLATDPGGEASTDATGDAEAKVHTPNPLKAEMYDESTVVDFYLTFTPADWQTLLSDHANMIEKHDVPCGFQWKNQAIDAVCHPKGTATYWKDEKKPQLVVKFNHLDKNARFNGLRKLNLEANAYHPAPVRDRVAMWLFRQGGVDAPRANHARVFVNGAYEGLYQNIEPIDHEFLEDHYLADDTGNLYENGYLLQTNQTVNDTSDLSALEDLVSAEDLGADHTAFFVSLQKILDVKQVLLELAGETILPTADNFSNGSWNYYYYDHPVLHFLVLPWDMDTVMDEYSVATADVYNYLGEPDIGNPPNKLRQLINLNAAWKKEFEDNLVTLRDGPYAQLAAKTAEVCKQIRDLVAADPNAPGSVSEFDADCADIQKRIADRINYVKQALGR